jgi:hypothetical protein
VKGEDGRQAMHKLFVESKIISVADFEASWSAADASIATGGIAQPFIGILADKGILSVEKALKVLSDKARISYIPIDKYDIDIDLSRKFPAELCQRWCVFPFDRMSKSVLVATANPFNQQAARELAATTPNRLLWYLASPADLHKNLRKLAR